jgi:hypothetical protein
VNKENNLSYLFLIKPYKAVIVRNRPNPNKKVSATITIVLTSGVTRPAETTKEKIAITILVTAAQKHTVFTIKSSSSTRFFRGLNIDIINNS